ncbi:MAG: hypothetical protein WC076_06000 [Terrimicrobiaceae bacterium]|nr:hypothetical protein [Terrimicrobiaceae bacterium]
MRGIVSGLLLLAVLSGCSYVTEFNDARYNRNNKTGDNWLSDQSEPAGIEIGGNWTSDDWGHASFTQSGRRITGTIGSYSVQGVVSGERAYLLIAQGDWYYYSAVLEFQRPGLLAGRFSRAIPYVKSFGRPMRLEQLAH